MLILKKKKKKAYVNTAVIQPSSVVKNCNSYMCMFFRICVENLPLT